jgi:hypothetical protein
MLEIVLQGDFATEEVASELRTFPSGEPMLAVPS